VVRRNRDTMEQTQMNHFAGTGEGGTNRGDELLIRKIRPETMPGLVRQIRSLRLLLFKQNHHEQTPKRLRHHYKRLPERPEIRVTKTMSGS